MHQWVQRATNTFAQTDEVAGAPTDPSLVTRRSSLNIVDGVQALLDAHLLVRLGDTEDATHEGVPRFGMLETIREYALERLEERDAAEMTARAHAAHFRAFAERAAAGARGPAANRWFDRLDDEGANLLTAITWSLGHADHEQCLRLTGALGRFWLTRGYLQEGRRLLEGALAIPRADRAAGRRPAEDEHRARVHEAAAALAVPQGEFAVGRAHIQASAAIWRSLDQPRELALALLTLSYISSLVGDGAAAAAAWTEGEALAEALADPEALAKVAQGKGRDARHTADASAAHTWLEVSLVYARQHGDPLSLTHRLLDLVPVTLALGDAAAARAQAEEALALARGAKHRVATAMALNDLGEIARHQGDYGQATAHYGESLQLWRDMGNRSDVPRLLHNLGYVALHEGDIPRAASLFRQSLAGFREQRIGRGIAEGLAGLAGVATVQGRPLRAARLWGAAEALREAGGCGLWPADQLEQARYLARARAAGDAALFAFAWQAGRELTVEGALAEAVEDTVAEPALATV